MKRFLQLHGLLIFKTLLSIYQSEQSITYYILCILDKCPITSSNKIEETGIDAVIRTLLVSPPPDPEADEHMVYQLSKSLLDKWSILPRVFKIPKRTHPTEGLTPFSSSIQSPNNEHEKRTLTTKSSIDPYKDSYIIPEAEVFNESLKDTPISIIHSSNANETKNSSTFTNSSRTSDAGWGNNTSWINNGDSFGEYTDNNSYNDTFFGAVNSNIETWGNIDNPSSANDDLSPSLMNDPNQKMAHFSVKDENLELNGHTSHRSSKDTDLFSHILDSTINSLKRNAPSIVTCSTYSTSNTNQERIRLPRLPMEGTNLKSPDLPLQQPSMSTAHSPMVLSPIQLQHIIRKATLSASQNTDSLFEMPNNDLWVDHQNPVNKPTDNLLLDLHREQWSKLLKIPVSICLFYLYFRL